MLQVSVSGGSCFFLIRTLQPPVSCSLSSNTRTSVTRKREREKRVGVKPPSHEQDFDLTTSEASSSHLLRSSCAPLATWTRFSVQGLQSSSSRLATDSPASTMNPISLVCIIASFFAPIVVGGRCKQTLSSPSLLHLCSCLPLESLQIPCFTLERQATSVTEREQRFAPQTRK